MYKQQLRAAVVGLEHCARPGVTDLEAAVPKDPLRRSHRGQPPRGCDGNSNGVDEGVNRRVDFG